MTRARERADDALATDVVEPLREDDEKVSGDLEARGNGDPDGRLFHAAHGGDEGHTFELWESREAFEQNQDSLFSLLQATGVSAGNPEIHSLHARRSD